MIHDELMKEDIIRQLRLCKGFFSVILSTLFFCLTFYVGLCCQFAPFSTEKFERTALGKVNIVNVLLVLSGRCTAQSFSFPLFS